MPQLPAALQDIPFTRIQIGGLGEVCGIRAADGQVICWGGNSSLEPINPEGTEGTEVAEFVSFCMLMKDGSIRCEGNALVPSPPPSLRFKQVGVGGNFACGIRVPDDLVVCWGEQTRNVWSEP